MKNNQKEQSTSSREIKFRAWHVNGSHDIEGASGKMIYYNPIGIHYFADGKGDQPGIAENDTGCNEFFDNSQGQSKFVLMQYTGLKDKNGKEIYEGDFIECDGKALLLKYGHGVVDACLYEPNCIEIIGFYLEWTKENYTNEYYPSSLPEYRSVEVIGNIYENHETF